MRKDVQCLCTKSFIFFKNSQLTELCHVDEHSCFLFKRSEVQMLAQKAAVLTEVFVIFDSSSRCHDIASN